MEDANKFGKIIDYINSYNDDELRYNPYIPIRKREIENEPDENLEIYTLNELLSMKFPEDKWLVDKLIPLEGLVAITGVPSSFKSTFAQKLAVSVACGAQFLNLFKTIKSRVLIIDKEDRPLHLQSRFLSLGINTDDVIFLKNDYLVEKSNLNKKIIKLIKSLNIKLIVIDSLINIFSKGDENSASDMNRVIRVIKRFQEYGAAVVFIHHNNKVSITNKVVNGQNQIRGSSDIFAKLDSHISLTSKKNKLYLNIHKSRQLAAENQEYLFQIIPINKWVDFKLVSISLQSSTKDQLVLDVKKYIIEAGRKVSRGEMHEKFMGHQQYSQKSLDETLTILGNDKDFKTERGEKNSILISHVSVL